MVEVTETEKIREIAEALLIEKNSSSNIQIKLILLELLNWYLELLNNWLKSSK